MLNEEVDSEKRMEQKNNHSITLITKYDIMCGADFVIVWQTCFIAGIFLYCTACKTVVWYTLILLHSRQMKMDEKVH